MVKKIYDVSVLSDISDVREESGVTEDIKTDITVDEGFEIVDKNGTPRAGYSAYGLCIKAPSVMSKS